MNVHAESHGVGSLFWLDNMPSVPLLTVRTALESSGLAPDLARDLAKRYCFVRAKNRLKAADLIIEVAETNDRWIFQLTNKHVSGQSLEFTTKGNVWYDKKTERIGADHIMVRERAEELFAKAGETYPSAQVSELIQRIFKQHGAILSMKHSGGIYFVPQTHKDLLAKIQAFVKAIGGECHTAQVGFDREDLQEKVIAMLVERTENDLAELVREVETDGLTKMKAGTRFAKLQGQVRRTVDFAMSMKKSAADILKKVQSTEINLGLVARADGLDVIAALAQSGHSGCVLGEIACLLTEGQELPALDSPRVQAAIAPDMSDSQQLELPANSGTASIQIDAAPVIPAHYHDVIAKAKATLGETA